MDRLRAAPPIFEPHLGRPAIPPAIPFARHAILRGAGPRPTESNHPSRRLETARIRAFSLAEFRAAKSENGLWSETLDATMAFK
jgi:hypothetical protein